MRTLRRALLLLGVGAGAAVAFLRLRARRPRTKVDLYYEDGSLVTYDGDSAEGLNLLVLADEVRRAARA